ncbi:hypothetical protein Vretimale_12163 [Volvox reticuliferus]|uniref:FAS1 domain-containing protein n=1 Tax=Volvox reticuliferus TaxID=1737510 RepID=A0A8J4GJN6_9CHLO|nr:hypothetical protein Vretimale_12163 [Volvox reticuliferus]
MEKAAILVISMIATTFFVAAADTSAAAAATTVPPSYKTLYDLFISSPEFNVALGLFKYSGLLPLIKDPNTMITCFFPTGNTTRMEDYLIMEEDQKGRYVWAILAAHCLLGQQAMTMKQLSSPYGYGAGVYESAFVPYNDLYVIDEDSDNENDFNIFCSGGSTEEGKVVKADIKGGKSIIHLIDNGMQYPFYLPPYYYEIMDFLQTFTPFALDVFSASSYVPFLTDPKRTTNITVFAPSNDAFAALLKQLRITKTQLLNNKALVDLIVAAHVINGTAVYTGAMISYKSPIKLQTMAGPLNAIGDLSIFPNRSGPAKLVILSNPFVRAALSDYEVGGTDVPYSPKYVGHFVDKVLIPVSIKDLSKIK